VDAGRERILFVVWRESVRSIDRRPVMRLILGILIGIGLTLGAAYVHDMNLPGTPGSADASQAAPDTAGRPVVNWDVLRAATHDQTAFIRTQWNKLFH
jgi:hypothetical protein